MLLLIIVGIIILVILFVLTIFIFKKPEVSVEGVPKSFAEKQFNTGEVTLNYVEGPDNGAPLLLIPGQMESWHSYKLVMPELAEKFHVFVVDVRGHGKSSRTPGQYSYNLCGRDLKIFLERVIDEPAVISGFSSGAVLAAWLAANVSDYVQAVISEDPPMFSSIWPRIKEEKYVTYMFQHAVDTLGGPGKRNLKEYFTIGVPRKGKDELFHTPAFVAGGIVKLFEINRRYRPDRTYDPPFLPFSYRVTVKFLMEYDIDFSLATIDGRLSEGFDPEEILKNIKCPMLLLHASWYRHKKWGLVGCMDDKDVQKIKSLVEDIRYAHIDVGHGIHVEEPEWYLEQLNDFIEDIQL